MIYIFEDDDRDPISQLFMQAYPKNISSQFIYAKGNGKLHEKIIYFLKNSNDIIAVYLDTIPGNTNTIKIYRELAHLSKIHGYRVIIFPILGAEYYFIKSIQNRHVALNKYEIYNCVNQQAYFNSGLIQTQEDRNFCKSYERYCKLILMKAVMNCVRNSTDGGKNTYFRLYYTNDCKCKQSLNDCEDYSLAHKSIDLLAAYPCVPSGSNSKNKENFNINKLWDIHRELVNKHNILSDELKQNEPDASKINLYKHIKEIK